MKLGKREKYAIYAMSVIVLLFVMVQFVVTPFLAKKERLKRAITVKTKVLDEIITLNAAYGAAKRKTVLSKARYTKRDPRFTLFSFLDRLTGRAKIMGKNIAYMRPSDSIDKDGLRKISKVEMKMINVTMEQITSYLHMVETSKNIVFIRRISIIKSGKKEQALDATLLVETIST